MRRFAVIMPFFSLAAGVAGFYLRIKELADVFNADTGLPEPGHKLTIMLITLSSVFLIICLAFSIRGGTKYISRQGFDNAFGTDALAYPFIFTLFGIIWLGATVKYFFDMRSSGELSASLLYFALLSGLAALSCLLFAVQVYQDPRRKSILALSVIPILFMCFWLIIMYKQNATNPILLSYCYYCLAVMASTLSFYYTAGFVFNKPAPGKAILAYLASIFFCLVTLADEHPTSIKLIFAAVIAVNVVYSSMLIRNLRIRDAV